MPLGVVLGMSLDPVGGIGKAKFLRQAASHPRLDPTPHILKKRPLAAESWRGAT